MIIVISSSKPQLESLVDRRFGRSPWLVVMDSATKQWQAIQNPGAGHSGGAGVAAAQCAIDHKADMVISGDFGPNAANALRGANVGMTLFANDSITVQQAFDDYISGRLPVYP
ncbi:MAG TPA: NifB/NifX family molybdenum-iron cluster-binding protein [Anaerolineaceae bacterium]|nr:NifB/NifX family molybdenum-iron cluster-binding protein [Anaerolineaceae bacterium]HPN52615.1 NifB/NifX family molybdenum-iron cluster-binding protein [Anaerolineaceae bacterium]